MQELTHNLRDNLDYGHNHQRCNIHRQNETGGARRRRRYTIVCAERLPYKLLAPHKFVYRLFILKYILRVSLNDSETSDIPPASGA